MFYYFEHQPITEMGGECGLWPLRMLGTIETTLVRGKFKFIRLEVFSGERFTGKVFFDTV